MPGPGRKTDEVKVQKPIYFLLSQIKKIDHAYTEDGYPSRADFIRTSTDFFLEVRQAVKEGKSDKEILKIVKAHMGYLM